MAIVKFGLSNLHVAFFSDGATSDNPDYDTPIRLPGEVNLTVDNNSQESIFYAGDEPYWTSYSNDGGTGNLEVAFIPDEIALKMFGYLKDKNGTIVEVTNTVRTPFALLFRIKTDEHARNVVLYNITAGKPSEEAKTMEGSQTPQTITIPLTLSTILMNDKNIVKSTVSDPTKEVYQNFYEEVQFPNFETGE